MDRATTTHENVIDLVSGLAQRYQISAIRPLLESCRASANRSDLNIAVLGRFKAGKSSFLNDVIGRDILPVGVVPVTSVVTEIAHGSTDVLKIRFTDEREIDAAIGELRGYVSEAENSHNRKHVLNAKACIPEMSRWPGVRFVDTPGLESAFAHNTEASLAWAPNVDIALVAVGADPALTEQDIELITRLTKYTSKIAILLTKVDILSENDQREVITFVRSQVAQRFIQEIPIYPYSIRGGFEELRQTFEQQFLATVAADLTVQRGVILDRKTITLITECRDYIGLTLKSSELLDSDRRGLQQQVLAEKDALADTKLSIQLVARNAAGQTRSSIEKALAPSEAVIRRELIEDLERDKPSFPNSFAGILEFFEKWLNADMSARLMAVSGEKRNEFVQPLADVQRQYQRLLQNFRDKLSERTFALYGIPLRTTEPDIRPESPKMPDVKIGRVFDHNWELLSPIIPMSILRQAVFRRLRRKITDETFKNLSRLSNQWTDIVTGAIFQLQREAESRIEDLLATVERLTLSPYRELDQIKNDIARLDEMKNALRTGQ
ncbi:MAG TPA: dynamin family protein [Bryobacteraceae bacterium]|nr:dynamin family protein [Bryobacteraceae bacterium]